MTRKRQKFQRIDVPGENETDWKEERKSLFIPTKVEPKTDNQRLYIKHMEDKLIVVANGEPGTGKTLLAIGVAIEYLRKDLVEQIIITRPVLEAGRQNIGFLPGTFNDKLS